jgi:hypothetical protein
MVACSSVDSVETGSAELIFVIGENLGRFKRRAGCRYVYLNFSVVTLLGNPFQSSIKGIRLIRYKRRLLWKKLDLFDALLDYYPPQTRRLVQALDIPVIGFVPWVAPASVQHKIALEDRPYDVGFVGGLTLRRQRVLDKLRAAGCVISPASGVDAEEIAAQSRCTLNIHMQRSNHLEIPRVMGALAASPLITEDSYGIHELLPRGIVLSAPYLKIVDQTLAILTDPEGLETTAELARRWYCEVGAPRFKAAFISAVKEIQLIVCDTRVRHQLRQPLVFVDVV